jgi:branched-chain amino acid transport system ATP-binding protein
MLRIDGLEAGYGGLTILQGFSMEVAEGEVVALIGANGAGKTTALNTISGLVQRTAGTIEFEGERIDGLPEHQIVRRGIIQVPEGRELFGTLTVTENLRMGATTLPKSQFVETLTEVQEIFPVLAERSDQYASTMSGGQQQMLAIGRALMGRPRLLMMDEPSLGLAPKLVMQVFETVDRIRAAGITVLIVEQNASRTLEASDRAYVLESGEMVLSGTGRELLADERVQRAYLGM